ncbi:MAG TPA: translation initiation factor IF-2 [Firmicutes bacterium]|nr:translation initiation factor IF-2 [Bacillota bacterium]
MSKKIRVHELSKELGIQSKDLIRILNELGAGVKNHMSTVDDQYLEQIRRSFNTGVKKQRTPVKKDKPEPPRKEDAPRVPDLEKKAKATTSSEKKQPVAKKPTAATKAKPVKEAAAKTMVDRQKTTVKKAKEKEEPSPGKKPAAVAKPQQQPAMPPKRQETAVATSKKPARPASGEKPKAAVAPGKPAARVEAKKERSVPPGKGGVRQKPAAGAHGAHEKTVKKFPEKKGKGRAPSPQAQRRPQRPPGRRPGRKGARPSQPTTNVKSVQIPGSITVKEFAQAIEVAATEVIKRLIALGVMAGINQEIDFDTAALVGEEFGVKVTAAPTEEEILKVEEIDDDPASLQPRWPVVTIMGHVDHGKTSLLDAIRESNVTALEAGGITQHIGAYQVEVKGKKVTFVDTPGHEAFTAMRARGAQVTDIAVLVVAADDGVMPQTVEAINHAKAAQIPIIVAVNKIDKPAANPDRVKQELVQYELVPEDWGGDTVFVEVSALKKQGLDELLDMILLVAELRELRANPNRPAKGTVIEAKLDKGRGPVATVLVQNGTLKLGDTVIAGMFSGKVRALVNDKGKQVRKVGPSEPVEIIGLDDLPEAGDTFYVTDEKMARQLAEKRQQFHREKEIKKYQRVSLDDLFDRIKEGQIKELNIILKADVHGTVEATRQSLEQLATDEVRVRVIHGGVGAVNESDVMLASASNAVIIGFNVRPDPIAKRLAEREKVDIRLYRVIYNIIDDVQKAMEGMLAPEYHEVVLGRAEVRAVFKVPKVGSVAGSYVTEGKITRNAEARVLRDNVVIHEGKIDSLKRFKDDVREVASGFECGIGLEKFNDVKEGDIIEAFIIEAVKRTGTTDTGG